MNRSSTLLAGLACSVLSSGLIISLSSLLSRYLGKKVLIAIERLMGMLLVAMAIQMLMNGIALFIAAQG